MVQEFHVLRCFSCQTFQVQQVKKSKSWVCKVCGEKQSLVKEFGRGGAVDCRRHVQKLNALRGRLEDTHTLGSQREQDEDEEEDEGLDGDQEDTAQEVCHHASRWSKYTVPTPAGPDEEEEEEEEEHVYTEAQRFRSQGSRKRKKVSGVKCSSSGVCEEEESWAGCSGSKRTHLPDRKFSSGSGSGDVIPCRRTHLASSRQTVHSSTHTLPSSRQAVHSSTHTLPSSRQTVHSSTHTHTLPSSRQAVHSSTHTHTLPSSRQAVHSSTHTLPSSRQAVHSSTHTLEQPGSKPPAGDVSRAGGTPPVSARRPLKDSRWDKFLSVVPTHRDEDEEDDQAQDWEERRSSPDDQTCVWDGSLSSHTLKPSEHTVCERAQTPKLSYNPLFLTDEDFDDTF